MQTEYVIRLCNITRFLDIGRPSVYFTDHLYSEFELENLDLCTM